MMTTMSHSIFATKDVWQEVRWEIDFQTFQEALEEDGQEKVSLKQYSCLEQYETRRQNLKGLNSLKMKSVTIFQLNNQRV